MANGMFSQVELKKKGADGNPNVHQYCAQCSWILIKIFLTKAKLKTGLRYDFIHLAY